MKSKTWSNLLFRAGLFGLALSFLLFSLFPMGVVRAAAPAAPGAPAAGLPLENLLLADGTLNLATGYRGALDLRGWQVAGDLEEAPRFVPQAPGDENWLAGYQLPGMNGGIDALLLDGNGNLYAGGNFSTAGGVAALRVARWDGTVWSPVGGGFNNEVWALAMDSSGNLYAGGNFTLAEGNAANYVAMWDGATWQALGNGVSGTVFALAFTPDGKLYAGGSFLFDGGGTVPYNRIVYWDGSAWNTLNDDGGAVGLNNVVRALLVDSSGNLIAGGVFTAAGGDGNANRVALWDGGNWLPFGTGVGGGTVFALASDGANLYAGGQFTQAGGQPAANIAIWDGSAWSQLGGGADNTVRSLLWDGSQLYVGGLFLNVGGSPANRLARWYQDAWYTVGDGTNNAVLALLYAGGDALWVGGLFTTAGGVTVNDIARWDGLEWHSTGQGLDAQLYALVSDGLGNLYAGGNFTHAGGVPANRVARWDGVRWHALGSGMEASVWALALDPDGNLYAGGSFLTADGAPANHVAFWNGTAWSALGTTPNDGTGDIVYALAFNRDGSADTLYAGGSFLSAGGAPANRIAQWDETSSAWSTLGTTPTDGLDSVVRTLAIGGDGSLYVAGDFIDAGDGTLLNRVGMWDGAAWNALGSTTVGVNGVGRVLVFAGDGSMYIGGDFTAAGGLAGAGRIARWDGANWSLLDNGVSGTVRSIALSGTGLFAGGDFITASGVTANRVAEWNNGEWLAMGSGTNNVVYALARSDLGGLFVGGAFVNAGDKLASRLGYWDVPNYAPVAEPDFFETPEDTILVEAAPGVLANDSDRNQDPISATLNIGPVLGELILNPDGSLVYTPTLDYSGVVTFSYLVDDGVLTGTGQVTITILPANDAPLALADIFTGTEEMTLIVDAPGVLGNDEDIDGDLLSATLETAPGLGDLILASDGGFVYTPTLNLAGWVTFTYNAFDGVLTSTAVVSIQLLNTNDPPVVEVGTLLTVSEGTASIFPGSYIDPDSEPAPDILWDFGDGNTLTGVLTPSYAYGDDGVYTATLAITDVAGASDSDWLVVTATNVAPTVAPVVVPELVYVGQPMTITVVFTDPGMLDVHIARIDWEPSVFHSIYVTLGERDFTVNYTFILSGTYTVNVYVNDDDGGTGVIAFEVNVLESPGYLMLLPVVLRQ